MDISAMNRLITILVLILAGVCLGMDNIAGQIRLKATPLASRLDAGPLTAGMIIWNSDEQKLQVSDGGSWTDVSGAAAPAATYGLASSTDAGLIGAGINQGFNGNFTFQGDAGFTKNLTIGGDLNMAGSVNNTAGWVYSNLQADYMGTQSTQRQFCNTDWGTGMPCFMMYVAVHHQDGGILQSWQDGMAGYAAPWATMETGGRLTVQDEYTRNNIIIDGGSTLGQYGWSAYIGKIPAAGEQLASYYAPPRGYTISRIMIDVIDPGVGGTDLLTLRVNSKGGGGDGGTCYASIACNDVAGIKVITPNGDCTRLPAAMDIVVIDGGDCTTLPKIRNIFVE